MTSGQELALEQLREIEATSSGALRVVSGSTPGSEAEHCYLTVSVSCSGMPKAAGGLPLRGKERLVIGIPPGFPFEIPGVDASHTRWASFTHVQWMRHLCLYQSPSTEWNPADGMYGFVQRLDEWLRQGAMGQLDPIGEPLHPPVAYTSSSQVIVPRADAPAVGLETWFGFGHLNVVSASRADVTGWSVLGESDVPSNVAASILLSEPMPFEYPQTINDLVSELESRGVSRPLLLAVLGLAALRNDENAPLYVIVGTPMRGTQGAARKQHLAAWHLDKTIAWGLRTALGRYGEFEPAQQLGEKVEGLVSGWMRVAEVSWCRVLEDRPEVTVRRDTGTPMEWFAGKSVALWGCGALGSHVAEHLVRGGVGRLVLHDNSIVKPGVIARQQFDETDIGRLKATALAERLRRVCPSLDVTPRPGNILNGPLGGSDWTGGADIVIDATASETVSAKLELQRRTASCRKVPLVSLAIGHRADMGMVVSSLTGHSGGALDVSRRVKTELCNKGSGGEFLDEFWPQQARRRTFQPEPGCSDPTFVGSSADVAALAGAMLNLAARDLSSTSGHSAFAHLLALPRADAASGQRLCINMEWLPDVVIMDTHSGYETRIARTAWQEIEGWIARSRRLSGPADETGGLLFGQRDDVSKVVWVGEAVGPPPDSESSPQLFLCGTEGTMDVNEEKGSRTRGSVRYVGMWHTHPDSVPVPSSTDLDTMQRLVATSDPAPSRSLLIIVHPSSASAGAFVFQRSDFLTSSAASKRLASIARVPAAPRPGRIGLALSGGGSRAIAFHLGCLRALHDRGVLDRTSVMSAVSGGSVIAGMYAYSKDSFDEFDARVVNLLRRGLQGSVVRRTFFSKRLPAILVTAAVSGAAAFAADLARGSLGSRFKRFRGLRPPWIRWVSRTSALEAALRDLLFDDKLITAPRRDDIQVIINACELRTGTAFRFGSLESSCWRFGKIAGNQVRVSEAVAASAAYPVILPAIDRIFTFEDRQGNRTSKRVLLTDGGVYDNLGTSCLEPSRSASYGYPPCDLDYIIACDAGGGQFGDEALPYGWPARMVRSFETVFRVSQNGNRSRLHQYAASGTLKGFIMPYLGQQDGSLGYQPSDFVKREQVKNYPTNFSPMKQHDIDLLALRGEQLTRMLLDRYCPEL